MNNFSDIIQIVKTKEPECMIVFEDWKPCFVHSEVCLEIFVKPTVSYPSLKFQRHFYCRYKMPEDQEVTPDKFTVYDARMQYVHYPCESKRPPGVIAPRFEVDRSECFFDSEHAFSIAMNKSAMRCFDLRTIDFYVARKAMDADYPKWHQDLVQQLCKFINNFRIK